MAVGLGHLFGFRFRENFDYPYSARSITEFWRRWHISLSTWFRDYLYIPLGGNRRRPARTYGNLLIVFVLCGLWHGASLTFLVWGLYHGAFLILERIGLGTWLERRFALLRHAYVLLIVMIGWVFFRSDTPGYALDFLKAMSGLIDGTQPVPLGELTVAARDIHAPAQLADTLTWLALAAGMVGSLPWLAKLRDFQQRQLAAGRTGQYLALELSGLVGLCLLFLHVSMALASGSYNPFIYFRF